MWRTHLFITLRRCLRHTCQTGKEFTIPPMPQLLAKSCRSGWSSMQTLWSIQWSCGSWQSSLWAFWSAFTPPWNCILLQITLHFLFLCLKEDPFSPLPGSSFTHWPCIMLQEHCLEQVCMLACPLTISCLLSLRQPSVWSSTGLSQPPRVHLIYYFDQLAPITQSETLG